MKKILFAMVALCAMVLASCSNDDIEIVTSEGKVKDALTMTVSPRNFISSYNFVDTKHNYSIYDQYRVFNSEHDYLIQARTYFYKEETGALVDSIVKFVDNVDNDIVTSIDLPVGNYYAITSLSMAANENLPLWYVKDRERLETAELHMVLNSNMWNIMSMSTDRVSVYEGSHATCTTTPAPVGSVIYLFYQNFQFKNQSETDYASDNGIRALDLYAKNKAVGYKLNPNAANRYVYRNDAGGSSWWYVSNFEPTDFNKDWTFFKTNLRSITYMLVPQSEMTFGYVEEGETSFSPFGRGNYTFVSGKVYLGYWDYFQIGNPYLGLANNSQWH